MIMRVAGIVGGAVILVLLAALFVLNTRIGVLEDRIKTLTLDQHQSAHLKHASNSSMRSVPSRLSRLNITRPGLHSSFLESNSKPKDPTPIRSCVARWNATAASATKLIETKAIIVNKSIRPSKPSNADKAVAATTHAPNTSECACDVRYSFFLETVCLQPRAPLAHAR